MSSTKLIRVRRNLATARWPVAAAALLLLVALPLVVHQLAARQVEATRRNRLDGIAGQVGRTIERQLHAYGQVLRGARGILATRPDFPDSWWGGYAAEAIDGPAKATGGLLWALRTPAAEAAVLAARQRGYDATFAINGNGGHDPLYPIVAAHPEALSVQALGYDLADDPALAEAIVRASATGEPTLSGQLTRLGGGSQVMLLLPVPDRQARKRILGVVGMPINVEELAADVRSSLSNVASIGIIDATTANASILVLLPLPAGHAETPILQSCAIGGRQWILHVSVRREPADLTAATSWLLTAAAFALGGLALGLILQFRQREARATRLAERMTADLRATQDELRRALTAAQEAANAKDGFLAMMSHELRTPLNGVIGMANLLLDGELTAQQRDFAETGRTCANGLLEVIDDILDYSRLEAGKVRVESTPFDPRDLVEEVLQVVADRAHAKGLELAGEVDPRLGARLRGDPSRLRQLLLNLLANAVKFTERGEVVVSLRLVREDLARPLVRLAVRDSGIGIQPDQLGLLFQPFTQADSSISRRFGGTGLGLAISKRLAEAMGGRIAASSSYGVGSEFAADIPLEREDPSDASEPPADLAGRLVLVIDDHAVVRSSVAAILGDAGCDVVAAASLAEADGLLLGTAPDLVVVDASGPDHDPAALAAQIRAGKDLAAVPVVFLCRVGAQPHRQVLRSAPVSKPVRRRQLRDACGSALGDRPGSGTARIPRRFPGLHVLVADARLGNLRILAAQLSELGCRCDLAADTGEALAAGERVSHAVVLVAADLPPAGAIEAVRQLRARGGRGLIVTTGGGERRPLAGCDDWMPSTPRTGDLIRLLARAADGVPGAG